MKIALIPEKSPKSLICQKYKKLKKKYINIIGNTVFKGTYKLQTD